jgi:DNA-binding NarL/FixJ family response regulator
MDINMPEMSGIEATRRIVSAHPDVVVILCSACNVKDLPSAAVPSGAAGNVHKERFGADLLRRLRENRAAGRSVDRCAPPSAADDKASGTGRSQQQDGSADPGSRARTPHRTVPPMAPSQSAGS